MKIRAVLPMPAEAKVLARLAATAGPLDGAEWTADDLMTFAGSSGCAVLTDENLSTAIALVQTAADEAEIITIGVVPTHRQQGVGRLILTHAEAQASKDGARRLFLEVAADNVPARALYASAGFEQVGKRPLYYRRANGDLEDALILAKDLV